MKYTKVQADHIREVAKLNLAASDVCGRKVFPIMGCLNCEISKRFPGIFNTTSCSDLAKRILSKLNNKPKMYSIKDINLAAKRVRLNKTEGFVAFMRLEVFRKELIKELENKDGKH